MPSSSSLGAMPIRPAGTAESWRSFQLSAEFLVQSACATSLTRTLLKSSDREPPSGLSSPFSCKGCFSWMTRSPAVVFFAELTAALRRRPRPHPWRSMWRWRRYVASRTTRSSSCCGSRCGHLPQASEAAHRWFVGCAGNGRIDRVASQEPDGPIASVKRCPRRRSVRLGPALDRPRTPGSRLARRSTPANRPGSRNRDFGAVPLLKLLKLLKRGSVDAGLATLAALAGGDGQTRVER